MSDNKLFKNNIGVLIRVYAGVDISDTTSVIMKIRKPSGTIAQWTATVDVNNGFYANYYTVANDLNEVGEYFISLNIVTTDNKTITGQTDTFMVYDQFFDLQPPNRYANVY